MSAIEKLENQNAVSTQEGNLILDSTNFRIIMIEFKLGKMENK